MGQKQTSAQYRAPKVSDYCPLCEGRLPNKKRPWVDLNSNSLMYKRKAWQLTPFQAEIVYALLEVYPRWASVEHLMTRVYPVSADGSTASIRTTISSARSRMRGSNVGIVSKFDVGYKVDWE